jgi:hypothetical protein
MNNEFALQCLKFAYDTIGYEQLMKELLFMKYNDHGVITVNDPEPVSIAAIDEESSEKMQESEESDDNKETHENIYCEKVFKNGCRCMIKTVDNSKYCNRHQ